MSDPGPALAASKLFGAMPESTREDVGRLMRRVAYARGEVVFCQGEPGNQLVLIESGELEALLAVPGGQPLRLSSVGPGEVAGELSLLGDGRRTATARATEPSTGWALDRSAFDVLRNDVRPAASVVTRAIGLLAVKRLNHLYQRAAREITGEPGPSASAHGGPFAVPAESGEPAYLQTTRFFEDFSAAEIAAVTDGLPRLEVPRGALLTARDQPPVALWIVVRGAVETTIRGATALRRLRLAGPGRAVGHVGLLADAACVERIESRARERAIVLEVPWTRVSELLSGPDHAARRFAAALWTDSVRALQHGERPLARMSAIGTPAVPPGLAAHRPGALPTTIAASLPDRRSVCPR
ncbi:MAG: cyclic nucleotide-binding domain (cNMP-BD) protein [Solirubrobacterales bacterium]|nr:cyclic nucleotide-binding domain (cNMP-BD) protein [Solirubrobacterales bacterium]